MRSRSVLVSCSLVALLFVVPVPRASASDFAGGSGIGGGSTSITLYGVATPSDLNQESAVGYGVGLQWALTPHWALQLNASRIASGSTSTAPVSAGVAFHPRAGALRPWFEAGASYFRFREPDYQRVIAMSSGGNARDIFPSGSPSVPDISSHAWGGYFGLGADLAVSSRITFQNGVRLYNWGGRPNTDKGWEGLVEFRSGIGFGF
jgi:outer membrane protein with beta-barrel domain